jgi:hypothetical protein
MPVTYLFVDRGDIPELIKKFNHDESIAFLIADGTGGWRAHKSVNSLPDGKYLLWHIPGGPLPLIESDGLDHGSVVENPWNGWREQRPGGDPSVPWLGDPPHIFQLSLWTRGSEFELGPDSKPNAEYLGISSLSWIGNYWASLGRLAQPATQRWWRGWKRFLDRNHVKLVATVPRNSPGHTVYAFPAAWTSLQSGVRTNGPWQIYTDRPTSG